MLRHLGCNSIALPSMEEVIQNKQALLSIHPADIIAKLAWDDYQSKKRFILGSFKGYLEIKGSGDVVKIDGIEYNYWDGLTRKLLKYTEGMDEGKAQDYINRYSSIIWEISCALSDTTRAMQADLNYLFSKDAQPEDSTEGLRLPIELDTPEARKYINRVIERGFIKDTSTGLRWQAIGGRGGNSQLGYFLSKIYDRPRPIDALELFFGVKKLSTYLTNAELDVKRADVIKWRAEIDKLFIE